MRRNMRSRKQHPKHDLTGQTFGLLHVIRMEQDIEKDPKGSFFGVCRCECGNEVKVVDYSLRKGRTTSCGCRRNYANRTGENHKRFTGYKEIRGKKWSSVKRSAAHRKIPFDLSIEYAWNIYEKQNKQCALTKLPITFGKNDEVSTASLDRIDSEKGYAEGNIQWTHKDINRIKSDLEQSYFIRLCKLVAKES